jgi:putative oxidoreductase
MTESSNAQPIVPALAGIYEPLKPYAYPLVRAVTGLWAVPHGMQKLFGMFGGNAQATAGFFSKVGLEPALPLVYLVGSVEFFGGLLIAIGLLTRPAAVGVAILMAVATIQVHLANGFFWTKTGFEYPLMWCLLALAIAIKGGGQMSVDRRIGKEV